MTYSERCGKVLVKKQVPCNLRKGHSGRCTTKVYHGEYAERQRARSREWGRQHRKENAAKALAWKIANYDKWLANQEKYRNEHMFRRAVLSDMNQRKRRIQQRKDASAQLQQEG